MPLLSLVEKLEKSWISPISMIAENEKNSQMIPESGMINEYDVAAVILVCEQSGSKVVPAAPSLVGDSLETGEVTGDFPRHLHAVPKNSSVCSYTLVDCTGFNLKCSLPILLRAPLPYPVHLLVEIGRRPRKRKHDFH